MKNRIIKFCHRGLVFSGFGPLIYGIVMLILFLSHVDTNSDGVMIFKGILSTYLLGFIASGSSIIWDEERLGVGFAVLIHGTTLYISYLAMYIINGWIPQGGFSILMFSIVFIASYIIIWLIILIIEKNRAKKFNMQLNK